MEGRQLLSVAGMPHGHALAKPHPPANVTFYNSAPAVNLPPGQSVSAWQGLRMASTPGQYMMVGTVNGKTQVGQSFGTGILFQGTIDGKTGTTYPVNVPGYRYTSVFGPDNLAGGQIALVGNDRNLPVSGQPNQVNGFLFRGTTSQLSDPSHYTTVNFQPSVYNYDTMHSISGGLAVGNAAQVALGQTLPLSTVAFIYNTATGAYTQISYPVTKHKTAQADTAYGIWYNGGSSYTICGGYKTKAHNLPVPDLGYPFGTAFLVDYNAATGQFSHWTSYKLPGHNRDFTHFEGISGSGTGVYTLNADWSSRNNKHQGGSFVVVHRNAAGGFSKGQWTTLDNTGLPGTTSSNAVAGNAVVGIVYQGNASLPYQATVNA